MKRRYREVTVVAVAGGHGVRLDQRPLLTPAGAPLILPLMAAEAVAAEWAAQGEDIRPATMPVTQLASTAIDKVAPHRAAVVEALAAYAETDLLCHRAPYPADLAARQQRLWQPLLDWAALRFDAPLAVATGVMPLRQNPEAVRALGRAVAGFGTLALAGLQNAVACCGSLVLGLALAEGGISPEAAFEAAELDESFQIEQWGEDAEASRRRAGLRQELEATHRYLACVREPHREA